MVDAGVWLTLTGIVVLLLLTVISIRVMSDVLAAEEPAEGNHEPESETEPADDPEDESAAVDGGEADEA